LKQESSLKALDQILSKDEQGIYGIRSAPELEDLELFDMRHEFFRRHDSIWMDFLHVKYSVLLHVFNSLGRNERPTAGARTYCSHGGDFYARLFIL